MPKILKVDNIYINLDTVTRVEDNLDNPTQSVSVIFNAVQNGSSSVACGAIFLKGENARALISYLNRVSEKIS